MVTVNVNLARRRMGTFVESFAMYDRTYTSKLNPNFLPGFANRFQMQKAVSNLKCRATCALVVGTSSREDILVEQKQQICGVLGLTMHVHIVCMLILGSLTQDQLMGILVTSV